MKNILTGSLLILGGLLTIQAQCTTITGLNENFDNWNDIDKCWNAESSEAMIYHKEGRIVFYSMMNPNENMMLSTPKVKAGKYSLSFEALNKGAKSTLVLYRLEDLSSPSTFKAMSQEIEISEGKRNFTITLPEDNHIGFKVLLTGVHHAFYLDNVILKPVSK